MGLFDHFRRKKTGKTADEIGPEQKALSEEAKDYLWNPFFVDQEASANELQEKSETILYEHTEKAVDMITAYFLETGVIRTEEHEGTKTARQVFEIISFVLFWTGLIMSRAMSSSDFLQEFLQVVFHNSKINWTNHIRNELDLDDEHAKKFLLAMNERGSQYYTDLDESSKENTLKASCGSLTRYLLKNTDSVINKAHQDALSPELMKLVEKVLIKKLETFFNGMVESLSDSP